MALYRTYRPQAFSSVVGQDHIKQTLTNALTNGLVAHAYLFSGPRGSGKTSIARILAMAVNCLNRSAAGEPCGSCASCQATKGGHNLAVIEIDAASNRGIDEIRQLRETIALAPGADAQKKVYIIDEVHMLTKEAFNALLKTLEEPPAHALFILATTELHRVPDTIISRVQHFEFKRATTPDIRRHLAWVAGEEKLVIDEEALALLSLHADGGLRDALSLLGQLQAAGTSPITVETVRQALGVAPEAELCELLRASLAGEAATIHASLAQFEERGYDVAALINDLILLLRQLVWQRCGIPGMIALLEPVSALEPTIGTLTGRIEALLTAKQQLRWSPLPYLPVELALLPAGASQGAVLAMPVASPVQQQPAAIPPAPPPTAPSPPPMQAVAESAPMPTTTPPNAAPVEPVSAVPVVPSAPVAPLDPSADLTDIWKQSVAQMQAKNASLASLLKASTLKAVANEEVVIGVPFTFYADRITDRKNAAMLLEILGGFGIVGAVRCELTGATTPPPAPSVSVTDVPPAIAPTRTAAAIEQDVREVFEVGAA